MLKIDPMTIVMAVAIASTIVSSVLLYEKWLKRPMRPLLVKDSNVIGEYMERYCEKTGTAIDKIVLVHYEIDERESVYRIESVDMYPEVWLGDNE